MLKRISFLLVPVLLIALLASFACGGDDENGSADKGISEAKAIAPLKLVPEKAGLVASLDVARIMADQELIALMKEFVQSVGEEDDAQESFNMILDTVGKDVKQGVIFADISNMDAEDGSAGILLTGVEKGKFITAWETAAKEKLEVSQYNNQEIYTDSEADITLAFLGKDGVVIGSEQGVRDVIDVSQGKSPALKGKLLERHDGLGAGLVKLAVEVPPGALEKGLGEAEGMLPLDLSMFKDIQAVTLTAHRAGQSIAISTGLHFASKESAEGFKGLLSVVTGMLGSGAIKDIPPEAKGLVDLVKGMKVSIKESTTVSITVDVPLSTVRDLMTTLMTTMSESDLPIPRR